MCPAPDPERIYREIKRRLMDGYWPHGTHLDPRKMADMLSSSITPVREALKRLHGERMVSVVHGQGFRVPRMNATKLRGLFQTNRILLLGAITLSSKNSSAMLADEASPDQASNLFLQLGSRSGNRELIAEISGLNDRLHPVRRCDFQVVKDVASELESIRDTANDDPNGANLRRLVIRYHNRRIAKAAEFIGLMTSDSD